LHIYSLAIRLATKYGMVPAIRLPFLRPLHELMNLAPRARYVHVLAAYPQHRGSGYGSSGHPPSFVAAARRKATASAMP
jgi:hypothetical protein